LENKLLKEEILHVLLGDKILVYVACVGGVYDNIKMDLKAVSSVHVHSVSCQKLGLFSS